MGTIGKYTFIKIDTYSNDEIIQWISWNHHSGQGMKH